MSNFNYENNLSINWFKALDNSWEFWNALSVMKLFWYKNKEEFLLLLKRAKNICDMKKVDSSKHFIWNLDDLENLKLTKYSSFLISIFADLNKKEVTYAKMFFEIEIKNMYV